jgi:integrase
LPNHPGMSGRNSVVECQLPKLDVAGSTPVARSNFYNGLHVHRVDYFYFRANFGIGRRCLFPQF